MGILIADSGSTKCTWVYLEDGKKKTISSLGISPYFLDKDQIIDLLMKSVKPKLKTMPSAIYYYGTGCKDPANRKMIAQALRKVFTDADVEVDHDLSGAARALCGNSPGVACILGTGSNSCFYNGKRIMKNSPGLGFILGDEGSGAYLGKKVLQYYLYKTFDEDLKFRFDETFNTSDVEILDHIYKQPLPNRYLASFTMFLANNRGHYMIENIIEDGLNDFFFQHICKYSESWTHPIHFVGSVAYGFRDVIKDIAHSYELELGKVIKTPIDGLIGYHTATAAI
jgi:glucosamine kinase